jgi:drug/metabolite transporter (DMT)-like permease
MPWSGLALGTLGVALAHQIGSDATFQDCQFSSPLIVILAAILGIILVGLGALGSRRVYAADSETPARRMIAIVGIMACAIYAMAIILPFIAALVIPRCWE